MLVVSLYSAMTASVFLLQKTRSFGIKLSDTYIIDSNLLMEENRTFLNKILLW